jgi:hypothetical protein
LKTLQAWIPENLSLAAVKKISMLPEKDRDRELQRAIVSESFDEKSAIEQTCQALIDSCLHSRRMLYTKSQKLIQKQKTLSNELKDGQKIKTEIAQDFQKLQ